MTAQLNQEISQLSMLKRYIQMIYCHFIKSMGLVKIAIFEWLENLSMPAATHFICVRANECVVLNLEAIT